MIKLIDINKIKNHPENPRKDLGDLTELSESIKQSGILQNLTLVPASEEEEGVEYYALIGNRRLGASKIAGLTEVPCAIAVDMDRKTQIATMLLENMQRSDLTVYEQAQGFQMMIDLGESVNNISEKTGFSETTVRRRVKLLDLDQEKLKESTERGGTLMDFVELEKIEDIELRNKVLKTIGTDDFNWELKNAIDNEETIREKNKALEIIETFAEEISERTNEMDYIRSFVKWNYTEVEVPEDTEKRKYFYINGKYEIQLLAEKSEREEPVEDEEEKRAREDKKRRREGLKEIENRASQLRKDFINNISNTKARKSLDTIIEMTLYAICSRYVNINKSKMATLLNIDIGEKETTEWEDISGEIWRQPELNLLLVMYEELDAEHYSYWHNDLSYNKNPGLDYVYEFLKKLGYRMSEEEKQLQDGTHELFTKQ